MIPKVGVESSNGWTVECPRLPGPDGDIPALARMAPGAVSRWFAGAVSRPRGIARRSGAPHEFGARVEPCGLPLRGLEWVRAEFHHHVHHRIGLGEPHPRADRASVLQGAEDRVHV